MRCPLCDHQPCHLHMQIKDRRYHRCPRCLLTFLDPALHLSPERERAHYDLHDNNPADPRYRAFLDRLAIPLIAKLTPGERGLDYGCGPGPALAQMLSERGFPTAVYDPIYAADQAVLSDQYDFVSCSEVVEHMHRPAEEFARLAQLVRPGGWLGVMTGLLTDDIDFRRWHYRRDPTHICFYHPDTFKQLPISHHWQLTEIIGNAILLQRH